MKPYTESMEQCATYWPRGANDGFGRNKPGKPVPLMCRWQDGQQLFRDAEGREAVSDAVVYTSCEVKLGGWLYLGESDALAPPKGAKEIRQAGASPSLEADEVLYKAYL